MANVAKFRVLVYAGTEKNFPSRTAYIIVIVLEQRKRLSSQSSWSKVSHEPTPV